MDVSNNVSLNKDFLKLLLNTDKQQIKALLFSISTKQIKAITEIFYNALTLNLPKKIENIVKRNKTLYKKLATKLAINSKKQLIKKYFRKIILFLLAMKPIILPLII